ncbi:MAG: hypothetical protein HZB91_14275 [Elusimicrobia bacterium]|nr:hypothetical protein [Elusimicrobiota bacterium]
MTIILINVLVIALLAGAYMAWQSLQQEPSKRWPKLAERLGLKYEGPPPRMTGPWKSRQVAVQADGERAVVSFAVRRPEGFRLEIGPREAVEKAAGLVVPDRVEFTDPSDLAFNQRFLVRCKPQDIGRAVLDGVLRHNLLGLGDFHILAEGGRFTVRARLDSDSDELRGVFDLASSILDGVEG